ncbi:sensor histidine kinase [Vreelandella sp.]|uniref:sensor histidine kinase n=1 Tax=Vreelandella sp. TaxID=3137778 RepID=UPI003BAC236E
MKDAIYALLFCLLLSTPWAHAAPIQLGIDLPYQALADEMGIQTPAEMAIQFESAPAATPSGIFSRGYTDTVWWLRIQLQGSAFDASPLWVTLKPTFLDDVRLYYRRQGSHESWQEHRFGDTAPVSRNDLHYRFPTLQLPPPPSDSDNYEVMIRLASTSSLLLRLELWPPGDFIQHVTRSTAWYSAYFGMATISTLLALILSITLGGRLLWSLTSTAIPYLLLACIEGFFAWWWPWQGLWLQHHLVSVLALLMYPALLWMPAEALDLRKYTPRIYQLFLASCVITLPLLLSIPLGFYSTAIRLQTLIYIVVGLLFIVALLRVKRTKKLSSIALLLGACPCLFLIVSLLGMLALAGVLPYERPLYLLWQNMLLLNMLFVMGVAVYRIRARRREMRERQRLARELDVEREARFHQRQFLGMVAHEFRTPLAIISGCLDNLENTDQDEATLKRHERMRRASERLTHLTDSCLIDARLDADALLIDRQPTDVMNVIHSALALIHFSERHKWTFFIDGHPAKDVGHSTIPPLLLDSAMMRIALSNVIDNAVKYSAGGVIRIDYERRARHCSVAVTDQGPGIAVEHESVIFERYRRGNVVTEIERGVGLGLYLSRHIARAHGGDLTLQANTATGCRFVFTLPLAEDVNAIDCEQASI